MPRERPGDGQTALVTGASAGIGVDLAECFAADGYHAHAVDDRGALGYEAWQANRRVEVTGQRNRVTASLVRFMPRTALLRAVRNLQSPI